MHAMAWLHRGCAPQLCRRTLAPSMPILFQCWCLQLDRIVEERLSSSCTFLMPMYMAWQQQQHYSCTLALGMPSA